jgi:hypothetical protein
MTMSSHSLVAIALEAIRIHVQNVVASVPARVVHIGVGASSRVQKQGLKGKWVDSEGGSRIRKRGSRGQGGRMRLDCDRRCQDGRKVDMHMSMIDGEGAIKGPSPSPTPT